MERKASLVTPLNKEELTTLSIQYNHKSDQIFLKAYREFDLNLNWSGYSTEFFYTSPLTNETALAENHQVFQLYEKHNLADHLNRAIELVRAGKHEQIEITYNQKLNIGFINNVHNSRLGMKNGHHALRAGGIRRHDWHEDEIEVLIDGLNLSRGMSYKNAAAGIPFGGNKTVVLSDPIQLNDLEKLGYISYCIDKARHFTGPDMGFDPEMADVLRKHFTNNIVGGPAGSMGPTGTPTAKGVFAAMEKACQLHYPGETLGDKTIVVQGLGAVGYPLGKLLYQAGAKLLVTDLNPETLKKFQAEFPNVEVLENQKLFEIKADILCPCAIGGIIDEEAIEKMSFTMVMGPANNQLAATSTEQEIALAKKLHQKGVLYQIDWQHNTAGVIAGWEEYINADKATIEHIYPHIERVCGEGTYQNILAARQANISPTEMTYRRIEEQLYS